MHLFAYITAGMPFNLTYHILIIPFKAFPIFEKLQVAKFSCYAFYISYDQICIIGEIIGLATMAITAKFI